MAFNPPMNIRILQTVIFVEILQLCVTSNSTMNCSLETTRPGVKQDIETFILSQTELMFLHFQLPDYNKMYTDGTIYKILDLVWTRGGQREKLLLMHPNFEQLSVGILKFGVEHVYIPLRQIPSHCFLNTTEKDFEDQILHFAVNKLNMTTNEDNNIRLCNMHVQNKDGDAIFFYSCCFMNAASDFICNKLESNRWIDVLFFAMVVTYVLAFMFSPLLIPLPWFQTKSEKIYSLILHDYHLNVSNHDRSKMKVSLTKINENQNVSDPHNSEERESDSQNNMNENEKTSASLESIELDVKSNEESVCFINARMKKFLKNISGNSSILKVNEIKIDIEKLSIVTPNHVPVGILHFLYKQFIMCEVKDHKHVKTCCEEEINVCPCLKYSSWDEFLKPVMQVLFFLFLLLPWFIRIIFFYAIEESERTSRVYFASRRNLNYPNILEWNVTYSLQPNHAFFIVCYLGVASVLFNKYLIKSYLDMSLNFKKKFVKINSAHIKKAFLPCKKCGIVGILIFPLYWTFSVPFIIVTYLLSSVPLITIFIPMIGSVSSFIYTSMKKRWSKNQKAKAIGLFPMLIVAGILLIMPVLASMMLCLEEVIFFIQIIMYVFIGLIINSSLVLTYVAFGGMLLFYVYDSMKRVETKYQIFSRTVIDFFISDVKDSIKTILLQGERKHCCLPINLNGRNHPLKFKFKNQEKSGILCLLTEYPLLFFDNGVPFISESLLLDMCQMKYVGAPGSVWKNYKKAFKNLFVIFLFLMFVAIIVLAFGQTTGFSSTYQAIATVGGGLIPLLLRKYFFLTDKPLDFKTDHILLQTEMKRVLKEITWEISDIVSDFIPTNNDIDNDDVNTIM